MSQPPIDEERVSKRVVYEHETSGRQNKGAIIAIAFIVLATLVFIFMQIAKRPKHRGELTRPPIVQTT